MSKKQITIGDYLLIRLKELGIKHIFGVPGDYNLGFLDQIVEHHGVEWIGTCNELNGSYASDGYARINGAAAMVTTFGVGELSAINGIAGAYSESVPVVKIVGVPALDLQEHKALLHHTFADGNFHVFSEAYKNVTIAQAYLNKHNAANEIDRVLEQCWLNKKPVYITIPTDVSFAKIDPPEQKLNLSYPASNKDSVAEIASRVATMLNKAKSPVILVDLYAERFNMKELIEKFLSITGIPFANMNLGKAMINENHPQFIGNYSGAFSSKGVQDIVENSDCIISFGIMMSDFNTGGFTSKININASVEIQAYHVKVKNSLYNDVVFNDVINALIEDCNSYKYKAKFEQQAIATYPVANNKAISQKYFWNRISSYLQKDVILLSETGTSMFGTAQMLMPEGATCIGQALWGCIGYTGGALLGAVVAAPKRQTVLFIGDGSFQLTAQEISTIIRHKLTPTIFLLNNDGYTVERVIHGPTMVYNDVQKWNYSELPKVFGNNVWTKKVSTEIELEKAIEESKKHEDKMKFIEVMMDKMDVPELLKKIGKDIQERNKYKQ